MVKNSTEFNEKWSKYIEQGHYGMAIENIEVLQYMDKEFEKEIQVNPTFTYAQIKLKFHTARVYTTSAHNSEWEIAIDEIIKEKK